jgi:hypothetical protein
MARLPHSYTCPTGLGLGRLSIILTQAHPAGHVRYCSSFCAERRDRQVARLHGELSTGGSALSRQAMGSWVS